MSAKKNNKTKGNDNPPYFNLPSNPYTNFTGSYNESTGVYTSPSGQKTSTAFPPSSARRTSGGGTHYYGGSSGGGYSRFGTGAGILRTNSMGRPLTEFDRKIISLNGKNREIAKKLKDKGTNFIVKEGTIIVQGANAQKIAKENNLAFKVGNEIRRFKNGEQEFLLGNVFIPIGSKRLTTNTATIPEKLAVGLPLTGTEKIIALEQGAVADKNLKKMVKQLKQKGLTDQQIKNNLFKTSTPQGEQVSFAFRKEGSDLGITSSQVSKMLKNKNLVTTAYTSKYIKDKLNSGEKNPSLISIKINDKFTKVYAPNDPSLKQEGIKPVHPNEFESKQIIKKFEEKKQKGREKRAKQLIKEKPLESAGLVIAKNLANVVELGVIGAKGTIDITAKGGVDLIATGFNVNKTKKLTKQRLKKIGAEVQQTMNREITDVVKLKEGKKATFLGKEVAGENQLGSFINILKQNTLSQIALTEAAGIGLGATAATADINVIKETGTGALSRAGKVIESKSPTTLKILQGGKKVAVKTIGKTSKLIKGVPGARAGSKVSKFAVNIVTNPKFAKVAGGTLVFTAEGAKAFNMAQKGATFNQISGEVGADLARLGIFSAGIKTGARPVFKNRLKAATESKDFIVTKKIMNIKKISPEKQLIGAQGEGIMVSEGKVPRFFGLKPNQKIRTVGTIKTFGKAEVKTIAKLPDNFLVQEIKGNNYAIVNGIKFKVDNKMLKVLEQKGFINQEVTSAFKSIGVQGQKEGKFLLIQKPMKGDLSYGLFQTKRGNKLILGLFDGNTVKGTQLETAVITPTNLKPTKVTTYKKGQFAFFNILENKPKNEVLKDFSAVEREALGFKDEVIVNSKKPMVEFLNGASNDALKYLSDGAKKTFDLPRETARVIIKKSGDSAVTQIIKAKGLKQEQVAEQIITSGLTTAKPAFITEAINTAAELGAQGSAKVAVITQTIPKIIKKPTKIIQTSKMELVQIRPEKKEMKKTIIAQQKLIKATKNDELIKKAIVSDLTQSLLKTNTETAQVSLISTETKTAEITEVKTAEVTLLKQPVITIPPFINWFSGINNLPPFFSLPGFGAVGSRRKIRKRVTKKRIKGLFKPSLAAIEYHITATKKPAFTTGFGVRPIIVAPKNKLNKKEVEIFFKKLKKKTSKTKKKKIHKKIHKKKQVKTKKLKKKKHLQKHVKKKRTKKKR